MTCGGINHQIGYTANWLDIHSHTRNRSRISPIVLHPLLPLFLALVSSSPPLLSPSPLSPLSPKLSLANLLIPLSFLPNIRKMTGIMQKMVAMIAKIEVERLWFMFV